MLKNIEFDNFKCLTGKSFELDKVNIFTGYNGRGKSSVMQAILMLSQSYRKDDLTSIRYLHLNGEWVKLGDFDELLADENKYSFNLSMRLSDNATEHIVQLGYEMSDDFKIGVMNKCVIDTDNYFDTLSSISSNATENSDLKQLPVFLYNHFYSQNLHYVSADRQGPVNFVAREEVPEFFRVGADGSRTINTLSTYKETINKEMNVDSHDDSEYNLLTAVTNWVSEIMNGGSVRVVGLSSKEKDKLGNPQKSTILKLNFDVKNEGHDYPSYNVGFGYSYILSIVVTALIAKSGDIVIIENPEAHLHPEAQTRLTFLLAKLGARGVQVFVETHSEHVINGFRLAALKEEYKLKNDDIRIFFFDKDFSKIDLIIEKTGKIPNWPNRFFDQYQHELAEIIKLGAQQHAG